MYNIFKAYANGKHNLSNTILLMYLHTCKFSLCDYNVVTFFLFFNMFWDSQKLETMPLKQPEKYLPS